MITSFGHRSQDLTVFFEFIAVYSTMILALMIPTSVLQYNEKGLFLPLHQLPFILVLIDNGV